MNNPNLDPAKTRQMIIFEFRMMLTIILFLLMIFTGIWMSRKGKPYHFILFNAHKLLSLAFIAMMVVSILNITKEIELESKHILSFIGTAVLFLVLLITGGILNLEKEMPRFVLITHRVLPILASILAFLSIYILI